MPLASTRLARDTFTGGDTADIDGRTPDGGGNPALAVGSWFRHPVATDGGTFGIRANHGANLGGAYCDYLLTGIPALPATHRAEVRARFPTRDGSDPGGPGPLCLQAVDGENPRHFSDGGSDAFRLWLRWVGGAGTATVSSELSDGTTLAAHTEVQADGTVLDYFTWSDFDGTVHTMEHPAGQPDGHLGTAPQYCLQIGIACHNIEITRGGLQMAVSSFRPANVTLGTTTWAVSGGLEAYNRSEDELPSDSPASESAWLDATVKHDPALETAYQATAYFDHSEAIPRRRYELYYVESGAFRLLRSTAWAAAAHDTEYAHSLEYDDDAKTLRVYEGDTEIPALAFALLTDTADADGLAVPVLTSGEPACDTFDPSGDGTFMEVLAFSVYGPSDCSSYPPYPDPPEGDPPRAPIGVEYTRRRGAWRASDLPDVTPGQLSVRQRGKNRRIVEEYIRWKGKWRRAGVTNPFDDTTPSEWERPPECWDPFVDPGPLVPADCDTSEASSVIALEGEQGRYDNLSIPAGAMIDASAATFTASEKRLFKAGGPGPAVICGGKLQTTYPDSMPWQGGYHDSTGFYAENIANLTIQRMVVKRAGDLWGFRKGCPNWSLIDCFGAFGRDDVIENDWLYSALTRRCAFHRCYVGFSARPARKDYAYNDGRGNRWTFDGVLMWLVTPPTYYTGQPFGGPFKWDMRGDGRGLHCYQKDMIIRLDGATDSPQFDLSCGGYADGENCTLIYSGTYPWPLPSWWTQTADTSIYDDALAAFQVSHSDMDCSV